MRQHAEGRRSNLLLLDRCLDQLEDANEARRPTVTEQLATHIRVHVPAVRPGMPVSTAISLVLRAQEQFMSSGTMEPGAPDEIVAPMDEVAARDLTEQIKVATPRVCLLLSEAHRRRAWLALGYSSWETYVLKEFGLSRSRSYELLDQSRVIRAMRAAAGTRGIPDISAYCAAQIKPYLPELLEQVREMTAGTSESEALAIVDEVVSELRRLSERRRTRHVSVADGGDGSPARASVLRLREAVCQLVDMPPASDVLASLDDTDDAQLQGLEQALGWLGEFVTAWRLRQQGESANCPEIPDSAA